MIPKTPYNVRLAYAMALEAAGLANAVKDCGQLLDDGYQERFDEYYPQLAAFETYSKRFSVTRIEVLHKLEWAYDANLVAHDPSHSQAIKDYFDTTFRPAVSKE